MGKADPTHLRIGRGRGVLRIPPILIFEVWGEIYGNL